MTRLHILLAAALALSLSAAHADADRPRWWDVAEPVFFNHDLAQGLPPGAVWAVSQDPEGFIWLSTAGGLHRWNGHRAERITTGIGDADSDTRVIARDDDGRLWLGTGTGLAVYDTRTRRGEMVPLGFAAGVLSIAFQPDHDRIWLGTELGVVALDRDGGTVARYLAGEDIGRVFTVLVENDTVWAGTASGLYRRGGRGDFERVDLGALPAETRISTLLRTTDGELWVGTPRDGVVALGPGDENRPVAIPDFDNEWIYAVAEVLPGVIWLGTYGRGVVELRPGAGLSRRMSHDRLVRYSLGHDSVWCIFVDDAGRTWTGTGRGVSLHDPGADALLTVFGDTGRADSVRDDQVKTIMADDRGHIWLGLETLGVDVLDPVEGLIASLDVNPQVPDTALPGGAVETILDRGEAVYVGSNWGLYRAEPDASSLTRLVFSGRPPYRYTGILADAGQDLLAGGTDGLWKLDLHAMSAMPVAGLDEFTDQRITQLLPTPDGGWIVGTWNGINRIDAEGRVVDRVPGPGDPASPLGNGYITALLFDERERLWVATSGAGLYLRDGSQWRRLGRADGLPSEAMAGLQRDQAGRIWAAGNGGLAVVDPDTLAVSPLTAGDGALIAPYVRQASAQTAQGELLFGGDGGMTVVRPDRWPREMPPAQLAIVGVTVGDAPIIHGAEDRVQVPGERNQISVEFALLDYLAPRAARYRYRLEGYDAAWRSADAEHRVASYTALPPGNYRLVLEASDRRGAFHGNARALAITVQPLWYQTHAARIAGVAILLLLIAAGVSARTRQLRRRQAELESVVQARTRELRSTTEALRDKTEQLEQASLTDPLTGLHNRRFVEDVAPREAAAALRRKAAGQANADLLFFVVDLDHFKQVNDAYGHHAGDAILVAMKGRLERVFRETDHLVRWGGEEFLIMAGEADRSRAVELAERIRAEVHGHPFRIGNQHISLTCSIGVAAFPFDPRHPQALDWHAVVGLADQAMFAAKHAARDAWVVARAAADSGEPDGAPPAVVLESSAEADAVRAHWKPRLDDALS